MSASESRDNNDGNEGLLNPEGEAGPLAAARGAGLPLLCPAGVEAPLPLPVNRKLRKNRDSWDVAGAVAMAGTMDGEINGVEEGDVCVEFECGTGDEDRPLITGTAECGIDDDDDDWVDDES